MHFEVVQKNFLNVTDVEVLTLEKAASHFALNGYEPLYVCKNSKFFGMLTLKNFRRFGLNKMVKECVRRLEEFPTGDDVKKFFYDNPESERLVILKDGEIFCEVNLMTEPPLINNVIKNLLALRFVKLYGEFLDFELFDGKKIFLISDSRTKNYFSKLFPLALTENSASVEEIKSTNMRGYDFVFDFYFGNGLLKILNLRECIGSFYNLIVGLALKYLIEYSAARNVELKFYRIPKAQDLLCLSEEEHANFERKISIARLATDEEFLRKFAPRNRDYRFVKERRFTNSLRIDDGRCIWQSDCCREDINVSNGVRKNISTCTETCNAVHIFGPCTVFGMLVTDDETIDSQIMKMCAVNDLQISVCNHGGLHGDNFLNSIMCALNTPVSEGDTFIFLDFLIDSEPNLFPNLTETFNRFNARKPPSEIIFFDSPEHCNAKGNEIFAEEIFDDLKTFYGAASEDKKIKPPATRHDIKITLEDLHCTHAATIKLNRKICELRGRAKHDATTIAVALLRKNIFRIAAECFKKILSRCDFLYLFVSYEAEKNFSFRTIFKELEEIFDYESICVVKTDEFFSCRRFLTADCSKNYIREAVSIAEEVFCSSVVKILNVSVRFFFDVENQNSAEKILEEYAETACEKYRIRTEHIRA